MCEAEVTEGKKVALLKAKWLILQPAPLLPAALSPRTTTTPSEIHHKGNGL